MVHHPPIELYGLKLREVGDDSVSNRNELRKLIIQRLWKEIPGEGRGDMTSHYLYYVENLSDGNRIFLTRPAVKRQGFDFLIHVENYRFLNGRDNPKHEDITADLRAKKEAEPALYISLKGLIDKVFLCNDPNDFLAETNISFSNGLPVDVILKTCKWFFIEQDIRYWNYSGRGMLKGEIDSI